jgi:hypothetical protein
MRYRKIAERVLAFIATVAGVAVYLSAMITSHLRTSHCRAKPTPWVAPPDRWFCLGPQVYKWCGVVLFLLGVIVLVLMLVPVGKGREEPRER